MNAGGPGPLLLASTIVWNLSLQLSNVYLCCNQCVLGEYHLWLHLCFVLSIFFCLVEFVLCSLTKFSPVGTCYWRFVLELWKWGVMFWCILKFWFEFLNFLLNFNYVYSNTKNKRSINVDLFSSKVWLVSRSSSLSTMRTNAAAAAAATVMRSDSCHEKNLENAVKSIFNPIASHHFSSQSCCFCAIFFYSKFSRESCCFASVVVSDGIFWFLKIENFISRKEGWKVFTVLQPAACRLWLMCVMRDDFAQQLVFVKFCTALKNGKLNACLTKY